MCVKICIKDLNKIIHFISKEDFLLIEQYLIENNLASDKDSVDIIKQRLSNPPVLSPIDFVCEVIYVILASGFSQKTAKKKYSLGAISLIELKKQENDTVNAKVSYKQSVYALQIAISAYYWTINGLAKAS